MLNEPPCSLKSSRLLVCRAEEDNVTLERDPCTFQQGQRHELCDSHPLTVDRPSAIDVIVFYGAGEGINLPVSFHCRHNVEMMQKNQGFFLAAPFETSVDYPTSRLRLEHLRFQALLREVLLPESSGGELVAWRISRIDSDVVAQ